MTEPTKREKGLLARSTAIDAAIYRLEIEWPPQRKEELSMTEQGRAMVSIYQRDREALVGAKAIITAMMLDADGFATLFELAAKNKWAFDNCVEIAKEALAHADKKPGAIAA